MRNGYIGTVKEINVSVGEQQLKPSDKKVYHSDNHYQDWIDAIKKRIKPVADVENGHRTAVCNAINIAYELQRPLKWNPKKEVFDDVYANMLKGRPYRNGWDYKNF